MQTSGPRRQWVVWLAVLGLAWSPVPLSAQEVKLWDVPAAGKP
jgi:hypothetical protein